MSSFWNNDEDKEKLEEARSKHQALINAQKNLFKQFGINPEDFSVRINTEPVKRLQKGLVDKYGLSITEMTPEQLKNLIEASNKGIEINQKKSLSNEKEVPEKGNRPTIEPKKKSSQFKSDDESVSISSDNIKAGDLRITKDSPYNRTFNKNGNKKEMVNHPDHYNQTEIETMEKFILINHDRPDKIKGALEFNIIKYSDRVGKKDPTPEGIKEDNDKIKFYMDVYELMFPEALEDIKRYKVWKDSK